MREAESRMRERDKRGGGGKERSGEIERGRLEKREIYNDAA